MRQGKTDIAQALNVSATGEDVPGAVEVDAESYQDGGPDGSVYASDSED